MSETTRSQTKWSRDSILNTPDKLNHIKRSQASKSERDRCVYFSRSKNFIINSSKFFSQYIYQRIFAEHFYDYYKTRKVWNFSYLNIGESGTGMMTETADHITSITVIIRMATEWRIQTQFPAFVGRADILINRVHSLQYSAGQFLKLAKFHWLFHAMIFQIIHSLRCLEGIWTGNRQSIHIRKFALLGGVGIISRSEIQRKILMDYFLSSFLSTICRDLKISSSINYHEKLL